MTYSTAVFVLACAMSMSQFCYSQTLSPPPRAVEPAATLQALPPGGAVFPTAGCECGECESCLNSCAACCCEGWFLEAGVMFLSRSSADNLPLILDQNTGATLLDANDIDFDHRAVPRFRLGKNNANCRGWDIGYFGLSSWSQQEDRGGAISPMTIAPGGIPLVGTAPGAVMRACYGTDFHSFEVNRRRTVNDCVTLLGGFRWIELSEELSVKQVQPTPLSLYTVDADNHLYGFQLGADADLFAVGGLCIDSIARAGVFYNNADQVTSVPLLAGIPGAVGSVGADDNNAAFLGELGFRANYCLSDCWSLQAGYHLIWVEGVALAPRQIAGTSLLGTGVATLDNGGGLFLSGASIGFVRRF